MVLMAGCGAGRGNLTFERKAGAGLRGPGGGLGRREVEGADAHFCPLFAFCGRLWL